MGHHAGVVGSPIAHSLSPVLHRAAYAALGLQGWTFHQDMVEQGHLTAYVAGLPEQWRGLAVTMPLKEEALALAVEVGEEARLAGGANTLTRAVGGWRADNTDVHGLEQALRGAGLASATSATVVGSGATARSALIALTRFGVREVSFLVREQARPETVALATEVGLAVTTVPYAAPVANRGLSEVVVSTVPSGATPPVDGWDLPEDAVVFDVVYAGWPTPWAADWQAQGRVVTRGDGMLLHQAVRQVRLMTGHEAPVDAMAAALARAIGADSAGVGGGGVGVSPVGATGVGSRAGDQPRVEGSGTQR